MAAAPQSREPAARRGELGISAVASAWKGTVRDFTKSRF
jgi:hypothetical protein